MVADFENYGDLYGGVTAAQIRTAADTPAQNVTVLNGIAGELDGDDKAIAGQLEGAVEAGTRTNPQQAAQLSRDLAQKGSYAVGLLNQFAAAVEVFDEKVADLNERLRTTTQSRYSAVVHDPDVRSGDVEGLDYHEIKAQVKSELRGEYETAVSTLDTATDEVATMFQNYTPENIKKLLTSGFIPLSATGLWPAIELTPDEQRQALQNAIDNGTLPDFATMTLEETKQYIQDNPEVSAGLLAVMSLPTLSPALTKLVQGQAAVDADILNGVIDGDGEYADIAESTARLEAINASIADGHKMTAAEADYIEQYVNSVGAENLSNLSTAVRGSLPAGMPSYAADSTVNTALQPIADSILNYSNPAVHRDDADVDSAAYLGSTLSPADGRISLNEMPQAIQDLVNQRVGHPDGSGGLLGTAPGEETVNSPRGRGQSGYTIETIGQEQFNTVDGLDMVNGWGDLISSASDDVRPGDQFGVDLAHQAIEVKQDLNTIDETAESHGHYTGGGRGGAGREYHGIDFHQDDSGVSDLLSVTARNENSSSTILLEDDSRRALLAAPWNDPTGAEQLIKSGTDHTPGGGGNMDLQARAASELIADIADDPITWENRMGENMSDAVLDVGSRWIDSFGRPVTTETPDGIGHDDNGNVFAQLSNESQDGFLKFVANSGNETGEDPIRWQGQAQAYFDNQIRTAVDTGDSEALREALRRSGDFDGRMKSATIDWASDITEGEHAEEVAEIVEENRRRAATATSVGILSSVTGTGLGFIPGAGPFLSGAVGAISGPLTSEFLGAHDVPNYDDVDDENRQALLQDARRDADSVRNTRIASWFAGQYADDPAYSSIYGSDGTPKNFYQVSQDSNALSTLAGLADTVQDGWEDRTGDGLSFNDTYDDSFDTSLENANVDNDGEDEDGKPVEPNLTNVADDEAMRRYLYGRHLETWYDENPPSVMGRSRQVVTPENDWSPQQDHVGTDR